MAIPEPLNQDKWAAVTARRVLPLLISYAHSARPITYGGLSREATKRNWSHAVMPIAYRYVAGTIGFALEETEKAWGQPIPPLNALVINEGTGLPGKGVDWFVKNYLRGTGSKKRLTASQRASIIEEVHKDIYNYGHWNRLLREYNLSPLPTTKAARSRRLPRRSYHWSNEGESKAHKALKDFVARHPSCVGLPHHCPNGEKEFLLPSADKIDVLFQCDGWDVGVEVKAHNAVDDDIRRGIYQCVKYREILRAIRRVEGSIPQAKALLVVQREMPATLEAIAKTLKVEWRVVQKLTRRST